MEPVVDYAEEFSQQFGPLQPYPAGDGAALPVFNIQPTDDPFFRSSVAGFAALMRYIKEYRIKKLGFDEANALDSKGTYQIHVHAMFDATYSVMDTAIYTWMDGKRHGLILREIVHK